MSMQWNNYQTPLEELHLDEEPQEIQDQFFDFINNVPYIRSLISKDRPRACDLPRDEQGRIIVDIANPHILEDMDYFRPAALEYKKTGKYTQLRPNPNPNSEYGKWIREEIRRCFEGYVRPSDGEWITGNMYFFINYCPIPMTKMVKGSKRGERVIDFPEIWEGIYYRFHYIEQARKGGIYCKEGGKNGSEVSSRGKSKSLTMAAIMAKYFVLGEDKNVTKAVKSMATAYQKQYLTSDGILNKFQSYIDFLAENTQFPKKRLKSSLQDMAWKMGYVDLDTGTQKGTLNEVMGVSAKDDPSKVRGKRMHFICVEEFGSFKNILNTYNVMLPSVREGDISFGFLYLIGTAGDSESDFQGAQEIIYNPEGYYMYPLPNVFDKEGQGKSKITFFFPGYINRKGCYDEDGNSDVTKALLEILRDRYLVKYNSTDPNTITKTIAEIPIVPQEALLRTRGNLFPVTDLNIRLNEIDSNPSFYDDVYTGKLISKSDGTIDFMPSADIPIREFPLRNQNDVNGAFEIYSMPEKNSSGKIPNDRYIAGLDPIDDDQSDGNHSLMSFYILDLWTDQIVAVYTGRHPYADDCFEEVRKGCLFYNARCLYENNKKGIFAYFSRLNCLYLLADTPEYLRDKELIKYTAFGNRAKGYNATLAINNYANTLIRDWMIKPITEVKTIDGEQQEVTVMNLHKIKDRALIKEAVLFNADGNFDRIRALGALMLYREEKIILYQGNMKRDEDKIEADYLGNDPFFRTNYDERLIKFGKC